MHRWTKLSMMRHYKPERHMWKIGFCLQGQSHSNWISVHTIKYDYFYYVVWTADFLDDQLSLTVHVHKLEYLVKRLLCCIQGQGHSKGFELQWMFGRTIPLISQTLYGDASSSARVLFKNIILQCSKSKPQSFLLDLQKYLNFCNPD